MSDVRKSVMFFSGIFLALCMVSACAMSYEDETISLADDAEQIDDGTAKDGVITKAVMDCSVSIQCANASSRSCNGTSGACSASNSGYGSVTCNGGTYSCPNCTANGICNSACTYDPDCYSCVPYATCSDDDDCGGLDIGICKFGKCYCI